VGHRHESIQGGQSLDVAEFFRSGEAEIEKLMASAAELVPALPRRRALDFGCGVGRLTQALASRFDTVCGVDIAPSMLEHARRYNRYPDRCEYVLNQGRRLGRFPDGSFDLIVSLITLQHMEPRFSRSYIREFLRLAAPGGLIVFQLPARERLHENRAKEILLRAWIGLYQRFVVRVTQRGKPVMEMHGIPYASVARLTERSGGTLLRAEPDHAAAGGWSGFRYYVTRAAAR
jgi:SAM-dependent methyltransferase